MPEAPRRVVLISGHYLGSKRRAGFHHLASAYWNLGWDVTFVTAAISRLSRLKGDYRFAYPVREEANRLVSVRDRLTSYVLMTRIHPGESRLRPRGPACDAVVRDATPGRRSARSRSAFATPTSSSSKARRRFFSSSGSARWRLARGSSTARPTISACSASTR